MGDDGFGLAVKASGPARQKTIVLWSTFAVSQIASQVTHYCGLPWSLNWNAICWLLGLTLALGVWILIRSRFSGRAVVLVVLGTVAGQYQTVRWLSALAVWRWRGFAP